MDVLSRWARRGALLALLTVVLHSVAPAAALGGESEPPTSEAPASNATTLALEPVCATDGLHRFAVTNIDGPATQFVIVAGGGDGDHSAGETMAIAAGETVHFWVAAEQMGMVEITWTGGSASAAGVDESCGPGTMAGPDVPISPQPLPPAVGTPTPAPPASRPSSQSTSEPAAPSAATKPTARKPTAREPAAPADRRGRSRRDTARPEASPRTTEAPAAQAPDAGNTRAEPRPRLFDGTMVCPDGWIPVDSDADGRFEAADSCEVLVETATRRSPVGGAFPTLALIVTIGLLVASIGVGAAGRRPGRQRAGRQRASP